MSDVPLPSRAKLEGVLARIQPTGGELPADDLAELIEGARFALHAVPEGMDFSEILTRHPINQVYFRAGLLACREYMARFVEQGGNPVIAQSIRANWWPSLGDDPGPPRLFNFDEVAEEFTRPDGQPGWKEKEISANIEALPRAHWFLNRDHPTLPEGREG